MKVRNTLALWADETKMALVGIGMVLRRPMYLLLGAFVFALVAYLLTMFRDGTATWNLLWSGIDFGDKVALKFEVWGRVVANFSDWQGLALMLVALLQGLVLMLLVFCFRSRRARGSAVAGLEAGGAGAALSVLAIGCPACGISLLTPIVSLIFGSGATAMISGLGIAFAAASLVLLLHAARRLGYSAFIEITARRHENAKV